MLTHIDLNRLRVFYYVYLKKSTVGAAKELYITRSAVSQQLHKLEDEIDVALFARLPKRLVPTSEGTRLFELVKPLFENLDQGIVNIRQTREKPAGLLRIGVPVEFGKKYLPEIIAAFQARYPDVMFHLELGSPALLLPMISSGELDFGFVDMFSASGWIYEGLNIYRMVPFFEEDMILAGSKTYYENHIKGDHSFETLVQKDFIAYQQPDFALQSWFQHHFDASQVQLRIKLMVDNVQAVLDGVHLGVGLAVVASHLVSDKISRGEIVPITTDRPEEINRISMFQLKNKIPNLREKTFQDFFFKRMRPQGSG